MPLRTYKATSPGRRWMTRSTFEEITTDQPHKPLLEPQKRPSGRNNQGRAHHPPSRWRREAHYRRIDFKRDKVGVPARLATIEYDPNRSARIGLLHYRDGEKRYMLLPHGLKVGDIVVSGPDAEARVGNAIPLSRIPLGTTIHNIELIPARAARSSGPPARRRSSWPRKASSRPSVCPRARCAACPRSASPRSARCQPRPREPEPRQGRARAPHGPAARGARRRDDPARPPAWWWRGQVARRACRPRRRGASPPWATARVARRPPGG